MNDTIHNPILRGFNPDPSIMRHGDDYYIATSTFEYYPAVRLHHSRDLVHWETIGHALDTPEAIDLRGVPDSGGVWAPSLSFSEGRFWLAYSIVRSIDGDEKDVENYLVTAPEISGPWSEPVFLTSRGFDVSMVHDEQAEGGSRHYITGVQWDHRPGHASFSGIFVEEYLPEQKRTTGDARIVYHQPTLAEGPNIYHLEDGYLLLLAEGGTGWNHGITAARATDIFGPYERDPEYAVITTRDAPGSPLAKAGHGELVQTQDGHWLMVHLASRPTLELGSRFCTLGRETALQRLAFQDGWPRLAQGGILPAADVDLADIERLAPAEETVAVPPTVPAAEPSAPTGTFGTELDLVRFATLRAAPDPAVFDLTTRPGRLHLHAGQSAWSVFSQSMLLERVTEHHSRTTVTVDAEPTEFRQAAGLIAWYDRNSWIWLQVTADEENGRHLRVVRRDGGTHVSEPIAVPDGPLELAAEIDGPTLQFRFRAAGAGGNGAKGTDGVDWQDAAGPQPFWQLSDDHGTRLRFTGAFIGVRAESLNGTAWVADFTEPVTEAEEQLGPGVPGQVPGHAAEYVQS